MEDYSGIVAAWVKWVQELKEEVERMKLLPKSEQEQRASRMFAEGIKVRGSLNHETL